MKRNGSANMKAAIYRGEIIGTPIYAEYAPHHIETGGGAWTYENFYDPEEEIALKWVKEKKQIIIKNIWLIGDKDSAAITKERGNNYEKIIYLHESQIISCIPDIEENDEFECYDAIVSGMKNQNEKEYKYSRGDYFFKNQKDMKDFITEGSLLK